MGLTLTMSRSAVIDLTQDDDSSPILALAAQTRYSLQPHRAVEAAVPLTTWEEPAVKRRRVELDPSQKPGSLRNCLKAHVLPHVAAELRKVPSWCRKKAIAEETLIRIATRTDFRIRREATGGTLLPRDAAFFAELIPGIVWEFANDERFHDNAPIGRNLAEAPSSPEPVLPAITQNGVTPVPTPVSPPAASNPTSPMSPVPQEEPLTVGRHATRSRFVKRARVKNDPAPGILQSHEEVHVPPNVEHEEEFLKSRPADRSRPYRQRAELEAIRRGVQELNKTRMPTLEGPSVYHIDFTDQEVAQMVNQCNNYQDPPAAPTRESLVNFIKAEMPVLSVVKGRLAGRTEEDIRNFCSDLLAGRASPDRASSGQVLSLTTEPSKQTPAIDGRISALLFARELEGNKGFGRTRRYMNFQSTALCALEGQLEMYAEFANCAGDIATISWVSKHNLICGTTTHSDTHNQQYNKPGNLLLCSTRQVALRAFADHRIPRPKVVSGENSTHEMQQSQDPWLYSSVVSSDYDPVHKRAYTSSFDRTVKVWRTDDDGKIMECLATWHHDGNVNFVAAAKDGSGRVASGADVPTKAVRIYTVDVNNISASPYESISCTRTDAEDSEKWAYYPATMQWGKAQSCQHILAVGYSPRSIGGDDTDIPDDKHNSGEITLWDANRSCRIPVTTATTANVFEVVWHPVLERYIAATSPCGLNVEHSIRTQIHVFQRDRERESAYYEYQTLDCPASDINELTIRPNSYLDAYVTAACTDGKVYVWDTAHHSDPIHVLEHDQSLEVFETEHLEKLDTGVKFTAWGKTTDHFYTGASDGVVRVWNIRNRHKPYVRTLLRAPAPISSGAFSPDMGKLAIGDATGRLYLFSLDQRDALRAQYVTLPNGKQIRMPIPPIPHADPPHIAYPPDSNGSASSPSNLDGRASSETAQEDGANAAGQSLLVSGMLRLHGDRTIGVVQGPNYEQTGLFRREAHENKDPSKPLLTSYEKLQQESIRADRGYRRRSLRRLGNPCSSEGRHRTAHAINSSWEDSINALADADQAELQSLGAVLSLDEQDTLQDLAYESGSEC